VQLYKDPTVHLLQRHQVEGQLDAIHNPIVHLKSGGYIVINSTEALVAIDVNSGRATRERNIEETALRTNLEAADEVARQLRLRDLAGLIVIDFIDMEESRNNAAVERRLKEAMRNDRARIQVGRISAFGLLELSRQRLRPSLIEASTETCRHCRGTGHVRSTESTALHVLRAIEEEGAKARGSILTVAVPTSVALYVLNNKRAALADIESKHGLRVILSGDESLIPPDHRIERSRAPLPGIEFRQPVSQAEVDVDVDEAEPEIDEPSETREPIAQPNADHPSHEGRRRPRRRRRRRDEGRHGPGPSHAPSHAPFPVEPSAISTSAAAPEPTGDDEPRADMPHAGPPDHGGGASDEGGQRRRRRRGRRGGRRRRRGEGRDGEGSPTGSFNGGSQQTHRTGGEHGQSYRDSGPNDRPEPVNEPAPESSGYSDQPASYSEPRFEHEQVRADDSRRSDQPSSTPTSHRHEPEPEVRVIPETRESDETPSSSPRRGWWKRLVE
jgi:ribonuclease E